MRHQHLREHLQVLRSHPRTVALVLYALEQNKRMIDWPEGGHTTWLAKSDVLILRMLNSPEVFSSDYSICTPEEAANTESESRDLVMEAYEDGHPHAVYSRFP